MEMYSEVSDSAIIELYFARDEQAITETRNKYDAYLRTVSGKILRDYEDVSECVSDTYLGAWNAIPPARPNRLQLFLAKITRNLSLKRVRLNGAAKRGNGETAIALDELEECVAGDGRVDENLEAKELASLIDEFLEGRSAEERKLFLLRYWYFDSIGDISKRFGFTDSKVKMTLKRTRDDLKDYLLEKGVLL
ncbi:MAG: sigma-70 family RNA polymerase sigma factor [Firmicutes bacterium]|nr:sigma-70 family RNA polymerase sigma factor [Bacillota bacterium]